MEPKKDHQRHILFFLFSKGLSAADAHEEIVNIYGPDYISEITCRRAKTAFNNGTYAIEDRPRSGRPRSISPQQLEGVLAEAEGSSTRELGAQLGTSYVTAWRALKEQGYRKKLGRYIPHELNPQLRQQRMDTCEKLLNNFSSEDALARIVTVDETWVFYDSRVRKPQWLLPGQTAEPHPRRDPHSRKQMLSIFWCRRGVIHYEWLPIGHSVTGDHYRLQLDRVRDRIGQLQHKRQFPLGQVLFHQDGAPPHRAKETKKKIQTTFGWQLVPHPAYSPDIALSDFHLFGPLKASIRGRKFQAFEELDAAIGQFIEVKEREGFFERGFQKLPQRWHDVIDCNGAYLPS